MEVQDLISNGEGENGAELMYRGEGENGAELMYRDDRENNRMEEVFSCTEIDTMKRECVDTSGGENSTGNLALDQTSIEIKTEPVDTSSENMEDLAIAKEGGIDTKCSPKPSDNQKINVNFRVIISNFKEQEKGECLEQSPKSSLGSEKEKESTETDSGTREKANLTDANSREHMCMFCDRSMDNIDDLLSHVVSHEGEGMQCKICHTESNTSEDLRQHVQSHQNGKEILLKGGTIVLSKFSPQSKLSGHMKLVLDNNPFEQRLSPLKTSSQMLSVVHLCAECNLVFKSQRDFQFHKENNCLRKGDRSTSHSAEAQFFPHICKTCGQGFTEKRSLTSHMSCHMNEKPYSCEDCGKSFREKFRLKMHKRIHLGEKPYKCSHCEQSFLFKNNRREHELIHLNKRSFLCDVCGAAFNQKKGLKSHMMRVHIQNPDQLCSECGKVFKNAQYLKFHFIHRHMKPEDVATCGFTVFTCKFCQKLFSDSRGLNDHLNRHTGL